MNILWVLIIVGLVFIKYVKDNVGTNNNVPPFEPINQVEEEEIGEEEIGEEEIEEEPESEQEQEEPVVVESTPTPTSTPIPQQPVTERFDKTPQKQVDRLFGIIGKPLEHSISITYFKKKFRAEHISADYRNFEIDSAEDFKYSGLLNTVVMSLKIIPSTGKSFTSRMAASTSSCFISFIVINYLTNFSL